MLRFLNNSVKAFYGIILALIILLITFFQNTEYVCKKYFSLSNITIILLLISAFLLYFCVQYTLKLKIRTLRCENNINHDKIILFASIILFIIQVCIFYNIFFLTDWDPWYVYNCSIELISGNNNIIPYFQNYYSVYPNNLFLLYLLMLLLKINQTVGVFTGEYIMMCSVIVNCLLNTISCYLVYKIICFFSEKKYAIIGYCLIIMSVGISPWSLIFYSDTVGLIFPILSFYLYSKPIINKWQRYICRFSSILIASIGYFIKPQCIIILIAIIIMEIVNLFKEFNIRKLLRPFALALCLVILIISITNLINLNAKRIGFNIDKEKTLGMTHFLMMGLNTDTQGIYSSEDAAFSKSFPTVTERTNANIEKSIERLKTMGFNGYAKHTAKKMLTTFNDGSFAWGQEGKFYLNIPDKLKSPMSNFLKSIYYSNSSRYQYFLIFEQVIWITILISAFASVFLKASNAKQKYICILWLTIIGLTLFEVLFEVRARYLYTHIPIFCVLSALGIKEIIESKEKAINWLISKKGVIK